MGEIFKFGIPGLALDEGDHVCAFYRGQAECDDLLVPHLLQGLIDGHKCTCVLDSCEPEAMLPLLAQRGDPADGFIFSRSVGEVTWALRKAPGVDTLVSYESELDRSLPEYPQVILCLYDLSAPSGDLVIEGVRIHPKLVAGAIFENPYYLEPDQFLQDRRS